MSDRDDDFLSRWSRRKVESRGELQKKPPAEVESGAPKEPADEPGRRPGVMNTEPPVRGRDSASAEQGGPVPEVSEPSVESHAEGEAGEALQDAAEKPDFENFDFESLDYESDYKRFMAAGVPEAIRKRALRMLWQSSPILANVDGLNDYDDDFTDAALAVKKLASSWNVGSGYDTLEERLAKTAIEEEEAGDEIASKSPEPSDDEVAQASDVGSDSDSLEPEKDHRTEREADQESYDADSGPGGDPTVTGPAPDGKRHGTT